MRFLLDVDGVVADLIGYVFQKLQDKFGNQVLLKKENVKEFYFFKELPSDQADYCKQLLSEPGCACVLNVMPGAVEGVKKIKEAGHEVFWLTSKYKHSKTWAHDRDKWLKEYFDVSPNDVIYAHNKFLVGNADVFVDDKIENIKLWQNENNGIALLYTQSYNKDELSLRRFTWKDIDSFLKEN